MHVCVIHRNKSKLYSGCTYLLWIYFIFIPLISLLLAKIFRNCPVMVLHVACTCEKLVCLKSITCIQKMALVVMFQLVKSQVCFQGLSRLLKMFTTKKINYDAYCIC